MLGARVWAFIFAGIVIMTVYHLFFSASPINPVVWTPPPAPALEGQYAVNTRLAGVQRIMEGQGVGPEDMAFGANGKLYTGYIDGRVIEANVDGSAFRVVGNTGGRPLGVAWLPDGTLAIADAAKGLLKMTLKGEQTVLATTANGLAFRFVDDLDVAADGTIYFSDASWKYGMEHLMLDFLEHAGTGRLLRYNPDGTVDELLDGLYFANGVALGPDDAYVVVNETGMYRVTRYWLKGPKIGTSDVLIDNLPGFPDNINWDADGNRFWLAIYGPRDSTLDGTADKPWLRNVIAKLPESLHPAPAHAGFVLALNEQGVVVANLQHDAPEAYAPITSADAYGQYLYLGSLSYPAMGRIRLSEITP